MPDSFRVASFNVQNLFGRTKVFNFQDHSVGDDALEKINKLRRVLGKTTYSATDKTQILALFEEVKPYIVIREDRGKLFKKSGWAIVGVLANGAGEWDGAIEFKRARFSDVARANTAKVIKDTKADVLCVVEAESRPVLRAFDSHLMNNRYKYEMLIDADDPRGIDVGLLSKYEIGGVWTHMFDRMDGKDVFSRDCLEVEVALPGGQRLFVLCNHFKSKGYDTDGTADDKRERQARRVAEILDEYDLTSDWVAVAGDLNDTPDSDPLKKLMAVPNLYDVLEQQFPEAPMQRWTYHYEQFEQIDFVLVSKPLKDRFRKAGVIRKGIYDLNNLTTVAGGQVPAEVEYPKVTHWTNAASDHGAVWAEFELP